MEIGEKIRAVREYRKLTGEEFGKPLAVSRANLSQIENGKRHASTELLYLICQSYDIDARFFFDQLDDVKHADLMHKDAPTAENMMRKLEELERKVKPPEDIDPLAYRVTIDAELREVVEILAYRDGTTKRRIRDHIAGWISSIDVIARGSDSSDSEKQDATAQEKKGPKVAV